VKQEGRSNKQEGKIFIYCLFELATLDLLPLALEEVREVESDC
jgi:hypothetical protein